MGQRTVLAYSNQWYIQRLCHILRPDTRAQYEYASSNLSSVLAFICHPLTLTPQLS